MIAFLQAIKTTLFHYYKLTFDSFKFNLNFRTQFPGKREPPLIALTGSCKYDFIVKNNIAITLGIWKEGGCYYGK